VQSIERTANSVTSPKRLKEFVKQNRIELPSDLLLDPLALSATTNDAFNPPPGNVLQTQLGTEMDSESRIQDALKATMPLPDQYLPMPDAYDIEYTNEAFRYAEQDEFLAEEPEGERTLESSFPAYYNGDMERLSQPGMTQISAAETTSIYDTRWRRSGSDSNNASGDQ